MSAQELPKPTRHEGPEPIEDPDLRTRLLRISSRIMGANGRMVTRTRQVLEYAEKLLETEQGDPLVVMAAAILHDVGLPLAEALYGPEALRRHEAESAPLARKVLGWCEGITPEQTEHICQIVERHHNPRKLNTPEARIVWDAMWLVDLPEEFPAATGPRMTSIINTTFKTATGVKLAEQLYLKK